MKEWHDEYSEGVNIIQKPNMLFEFRFPTQPGHVNYITRKVANLGEIIEAKIHVNSRTSQFRPLDTTKGLPPNFRLYFQKKGDDMTSDGNRWWSNPNYSVLHDNGDAYYNITVPVKPASWSTVFGGMGNKDKQHEDWFRDAVANVDKIGFTFGGGNSFGHGIYILGSNAVFYLKELKK